MKRNYTHIKMYGKEILEMREAGCTQREIAEHFGFKDKNVVKYFLKRERDKQETILTEKLPKQRGRKPAITLAEYKYENKRLTMENELLRDFLRLAGRR